MKYLALLAGMLYLFACSDKDSGTDDCPTHEYGYTIKANSKIDTFTNSFFQFNISEHGNKNVFVYTHTFQRCAMAYDGGYIENLVFEVPANATSFSLTNDELIDAKTYYRVSCYCDPTARVVNTGTIKGQKLGSTTWRVEGDITIPGINKAISFNETFKVQ